MSTATPPDLILASSSPRRRELLQLAGWKIDVMPANVDETQFPGESPEQYVLRVAREKAHAVASQRALTHWPAPILAADTAVVIDNEIMGKPQDAEDAREMLRRLAGRMHQVWTGVCIIDAPNEREVVATENTRVWFSPLTPQDIEQYIRSAEPMDKAGAYGIQGQAAKFIPRIEGCYFNVVGLPLATVRKMLRDLELLRYGNPGAQISG